LLLEIHSIL